MAISIYALVILNVVKNFVLFPIPLYPPSRREGGKKMRGAQPLSLSTPALP